MPEDNVHKGHRKRMKSKFLLHGIEVFEEHEVLEMLLYYAVPRCDTNPIAHKLLERFGSISAIFDATVDMLTDAGLSENTAVLIKMIPALSRIYMEDKHNNPGKIVDFDNLVEFFANKYIGRNEEVVMLLLADSKGKELFCGVISKGSINASDIPVRRVVDLALRYNAKTAVIAHNHPTGVAVPSTNDIKSTINIYNALAHVNVLLADHIIIADNDGISMTYSEFGEGIFYSLSE